MYRSDFGPIRFFALYSRKKPLHCLYLLYTYSRITVTHLHKFQLCSEASLPFAQLTVQCLLLQHFRKIVVRRIINCIYTVDILFQPFSYLTIINPTGSKNTTVLISRAENLLLLMNETQSIAKAHTMNITVAEIYVFISIGFFLPQETEQIKVSNKNIDSIFFIKKHPFIYALSVRE